MNPMLQIYLLTFVFSFQPSMSKQFYNPTPCSFSLYTCTTTPSSCNTFIIYRSRHGFNTISTISQLFGVETYQVQLLNNITNSSQTLEKNREVLLPIHCSCSDGGFRSMLDYTTSSVMNYTEISCDVFEGLAAFHSGNLTKEVNLKVPLKCACPDVNSTKKGIQYLVTYPIQESDEPKVIAEKFNISDVDLLAQNTKGSDMTLFPNTTILVPLRNVTSINWNISDPRNRDHGFIQLTPREMINMKARKRNLYAIGAIIGLVLIIVVLFGFVCYFKAKNKRISVTLGYLSAHSSNSSCLSPDLIAVISKYSLKSYAIEELSEATDGFNEQTQLGGSVFKGKFGCDDLVIKEMGFGDARRTISIHSKINHSSIVKLEGVCYGDDKFSSSSFLVFEFLQNGSLRDCLKSSMQAISWHNRTQIAFDVAIGLHYIHHCTVPSYIHMNITSKNILITDDWRAKIANLGAGSVINSFKERRRNAATNSKGWIAPEYFNYGPVSPKIDVFGFGVVLFELLSAKEVKDGSFVREKLCFLNGGGGVISCFDELREFLDPNLKDYPIGEVLCMTVLAKGCVEENPMNRPSMNDILKILARMVR